MKIIYKKHVRLWLLPVLFSAALSAGINANPALMSQDEASVVESAEENKPDTEQVVPQPKFTVLPDKLNSGLDSLTSQSPVHYYGFVSQRGQDVLLHSPNGDPANKAWRVEYYEKGEWVVQNTATKVFTKLSPGDNVIVRITAKNPEILNELTYAVVLGSYPVLKGYDLFDEPGVIRIPSGYTEPNWLATQVYKEATLEVRFTDTKGVTLEGGVALFGLTFCEGEKSMKGVFVSGANGIVSTRLELGRCYGGVEAKDFVDKQMGFNTWRSYYKVADYFVTNFYVSPLPKASDFLRLGHICDQQVMRTVAPNN